ncbi:MAG: hypothetical protein JOY82_03345 [Streptosporangiaceae bacterium]|nr:hypothetical protein [Streptosporangiaceae bacterium]MBV9853548.1 hypothetical protein [Streptosporangiaceae bacterium]
MSTENDLNERLDHTFRAITPNPAPVEDAMLRGRAIRMRRRIATAVSVAAVAAIGALAVPALLPRHTAVQPATRPTVTVQPPGPHSAAGLVASGLVNDLPWQVFIYRPGTHSAPRGQQCFAALGAAFEAAPGEVQDCGPVSGWGNTTDPVSFLGASGGIAQAGLGRVRANVAYATVKLADGTVLTLQPVTVYGERYVAFAAPMTGGITSITAYSRAGEIATAIPFRIPQGPAIVSAWLRPGQQVPARVTKLIASGTTDGNVWSVTVHLGPWGSCLVSSGGGTSCVPVVSPLGMNILGWSSGSPAVVYGSAAASVDRVVIALSDGTTIPARVVQVGDQRFFAFAVGQGKSAKRWTAYDGSGKIVAAGKVPLSS